MLGYTDCDSGWHVQRSTRKPLYWNPLYWNPAPRGFPGEFYFL